MSTTAAWYPDPLNWHQLRYWDGDKWTDHVADDGTTTVDPMSRGQRPIQAAAPAGPTPLPAPGSHSPGGGMSQPEAGRAQFVAGIVRELMQENLGDAVFVPLAGGVPKQDLTCHFDGISLTVVSIEAGDPLSVVTTVGLGRDVPVSAELMHWVNEKNKGIKFGRVYYGVGQDPSLCVVILQEYVSGDFVNADDFGSQLAVTASVGPTMAHGWALSSEVVSTFGGRHFGRGDTAFLLFVS